MGAAVCPANGNCDEHETEFAGIGKGEDDPPLAGRWISGRGNLHVIGVDSVQWRSGDITKIKKRAKFDGRGAEYATELNGTLYTARLTPEGHLKWSDGDTWKRDMRGPETGTYAAVSDVFVRAGESFHSTFFASPDVQVEQGAVVEESSRIGMGTPARREEPQALPSDGLRSVSTPSRSPQPREEFSTVPGSSPVAQYMGSPGWMSENPYMSARSPVTTTPNPYAAAGSPYVGRGDTTPRGEARSAGRSEMTPRGEARSAGGGPFFMQDASPYAASGSPPSGGVDGVIVPRPKRRIQSPKASLMPDR